MVRLICSSIYCSVSFHPSLDKSARPQRIYLAGCPIITERRNPSSPSHSETGTPLISATSALQSIILIGDGVSYSPKRRTSMVYKYIDLGGVENALPRPPPPPKGLRLLKPGTQDGRFLHDSPFGLVITPSFRVLR